MIKMKSNGFRISIFIVLALFVGCGGGSQTISEEGQQVITFDLSGEPADIFSLDLFEEPVVLNLANDSILVGTVTQAVSAGDRIYLLDQDAGRQSISVLDRQGQWIKKIQRMGRGPLEYLGLETIFFDRKKESLAAYCRMGQKIIYFDPDGNTLSETKMPKMFMFVWPTDRGYAGDMANYGEDKNRRDNLWLMDPDFVLGDSFFEIPQAWESSTSTFWPFSTYRDKTYYTRQIDNNVYSIEENRVTAPYRFDFGAANWPDPKAGYEESRRIRQENMGRYVDRLGRVQETDRHLIVQFIHEGQRRLGVYDKVSKESTVCSLEPYMGKYFIPFGDIVGMDSEAVYTIIDAYRIKRLWNGKDEYNDFEAMYPEQIRRLREDFPEVDESGNPFIVIYRFKQHS